MPNILITGGTGAIGSVLVKEMTDDGHFVVFTSRSFSRGSRFIEETIHQAERCRPVELDFLNLPDLVAWCSSLPNPIEGVIHNARSLDFIKPDDQGRLSAEQLQMEYYLAVTIPYLLTYALIDAGHPLRDVIFISSMYGMVAPTPRLYDDFKRQSPVNYGVAKAAQIHLTKELAVRLKDERIRVNCISYGGLKGRAGKEFEQRYENLTPSARMLENQDLYPPVQYIINNPNLAINGQNIQVDGGWTIW